MHIRAPPPPPPLRRDSEGARGTVGKEKKAKFPSFTSTFPEIPARFFLPKSTNISIALHRFPLEKTQGTSMEERVSVLSGQTSRVHLPIIHTTSSHLALQATVICPEGFPRVRDFFLIFRIRLFFFF